MRFSRLLLFVFIGTVLMIQSPGSALACSCMMPESTLQSVDDSSAVFLGTVEKISKTSQWETSVTINVQEEWKGDVSVGADVTVITANDSAACGYQFTEDQEYLVYAHRNETTGKLGVSLCSSTKTKAQAADDLKVLAMYDGESPSSACSPYMCKDGTKVARCSEEGYVINYFAPPCTMHGGEAGEGAVSAPFSDVPTKHPNLEAIAYVKAEGIVEGYSDGTYRPDQTINRAEFTKIIIKGNFSMNELANCDKKKLIGFSDTNTDAWYAQYLCVAVQYHINGGYPDGTFRPDADVNFVEAAKMMIGAFIREGEAGPSYPGMPWYEPFVDLLSTTHAIPVSIQSLDQKVTRGEMAEMIWRISTENISEASVDYETLIRASR